MKRHFGANKDDKLFILIWRIREGLIQKFKFEGEFNEENAIQFVDDYFDNKIPIFYKS